MRVVLRRPSCNVWLEAIKLSHKGLISRVDSIGRCGKIWQSVASLSPKQARVSLGSKRLFLLSAALPTHMKAVVLKDHDGTPQSLAVADLSLPIKRISLLHLNVLIKLAATSIGPADLMFWHLSLLQHQAEVYLQDLKG